VSNNEEDRGMRRIFRLSVMLVLAWTLLPLSAAEPVPAPLREWQQWVMKDQEFRACPFLATRTPGDARSHVCAWPGALELELGASGGSFRQRWQVYTEDWVRLPGNLEHWPREVRLDGATAAVVAREGVPQVRLAPGTHELSGRFAWASRPEQLAVPPESALIRLTLDGRLVAQPEHSGNALWLGQRQGTAERERLDLTVHRLLRDDLPARLITQVTLYVSGPGREALVGPVLPAGFVPLALEGDLPARLENDGRLRVQLRPGQFRLRLEARGPGVAATITRPEAAAPWPEEEVWSFEGVDRLRVAAVEGAESIDPAQANVPGDWRRLPAFRLPAAGSLTVAERSRALANPDDNRLSLDRHLWLDFDHGGFTITDHIGGRLNRDWRLDMAPPYLLEAARSTRDDSPLLVTAGADGAAGVELRERDLQLFTIARLDGARGSLPATGWSTRFDQAGGELHLPPGHRLLAAPGADYARGSWVGSWGLWDLFGVLVVIVLAHWVAGPVLAVLAAVALVLLYQEAPPMIWLWANVIAAVALLRAAPEGRLRRFAARYRLASFVLLVLALLPLLVGQLRLAIYPQLDTPAFSGSMRVRMDAAMAGASAVRPEEALKQAPATAPAELAHDGAMEQVSVTGVRAQFVSVLNRYAAGTQLQSGPGVPGWRYNTYAFGWSGPVEPSQSVRFLWLGPVALGLWRIVGVVATALFALLLARAAFNLPLDAPWLPAGLRRVLPRTGAAAAAGLLLFAAPTDRAAAQAYPSTELLNELRTRLTQPPPCRNSCAEIISAEVRADGDRLEVELAASALADVAVALPQAGDLWQLERVEVDGRAAPFALRQGDGSAWLPLTPGAHRLRLSGRLANAETVQLNFPQPPRTLSVSTRGWDAAGASNGRLLAGSLELIRRRSAGSATSELAPSEFAPFVKVTRHFSFDLDWGVRSVVERIAPRAAPLQVSIPLAPGESLLTSELEVRDGAVTLALPRGAASATWSSLLPRTETLSLTLPADAQRTEEWVFAVGPEWNVQFEGFPPSLPPNEGGQWSFHFVPRAGETLNLTIRRPAPAPGQTLAIDSVVHRSEFGRRSVNGSLQLGYRSTQAGRHTLTLPAEARVTEVRVNGEPVPIRPDNGQLPLSVLAGRNLVEIQWTMPRGAGFITRPDAIDLGIPASNVRTGIVLPQHRWPLLARGPGVGTTILYWGEIVVFLALAWALSRWRRSPLRLHEWLLLGLGLSTLSWPVFATVAAWLIVMRWREGWDHAGARRWVFHTVQVVLAVFSVVALSSLVFSGVRYGLLATPDMSLDAPGGSFGAADGFAWFLDRSGTTLPRPAVVSVPMWVYRVLMFAWAAWIAVALRRWLPAAWRAWTAGGLWRGRVVPPPKPGPGAAAEKA
jgi:hypothetical protein